MKRIMRAALQNSLFGRFRQSSTNPNPNPNPNHNLYQAQYTLMKFMFHE